MEPAELRLAVVTWLQREAFGRVVGGNTRVPLADVSHPGVVKVLTLSERQKQELILHAGKSCTRGQSVTLSFIYSGSASVLDTKLDAFRSSLALGSFLFLFFWAAFNPQLLCPN